MVICVLLKGKSFTSKYDVKKREHIRYKYATGVSAANQPRISHRENGERSINVVDIYVKST